MTGALTRKKEDRQAQREGDSEDGDRDCKSRKAWGHQKQARKDSSLDSSEGGWPC